MAKTPTKSKQAEGSGIQVISRAADILKLLKEDTTGLSLGKIAKRVELPRSTVQRIINALISENFVAVAGEQGGYVIGPEIILMANSAKLDVPKLLNPFLMRLSKETNETVDLAIFKTDQMEFVDQVVGSHRLRAVSAIGDRFPMTVTANGKAVLALLNKDRIKQIFLQEQANKTIQCSYTEFCAELTEIRRTGYAIDRDEHTPGISAVGVAFNIGEQFYALSIPAPTHRYDKSDQEFARRLLSAIIKARPSVPGLEFQLPKPKAA